MKNVETTFRMHTPVSFEGPYSVLLLEDCEFDRRRFSRMMRKVCPAAEITEVVNFDQLALAADQKAYNLVVLDYYLPTGTAETAVENLQVSRLNGSVRPVILSGNLNPKIALQSYRWGCKGYFEKAKLSPDMLAELIAPERSENRRKLNQRSRKIPAGTKIGLDFWYPHQSLRPL